MVKLGWRRAAHLGIYPHRSTLEYNGLAPLSSTLTGTPGPVSRNQSRPLAGCLAAELKQQCA